MSNIQQVYPIITVGDVKKALEGVPDDKLIIGQVVGTEKGAWNLPVEICPKISQGNIAMITLKHHELRELPEIE